MVVRAGARAATAPQRAALERYFTEAFIENHVSGGGRAGAQIHRAGQNANVPQSTVLSLKDALDLGKNFADYVRGLSMPTASHGGPLFVPIPPRRQGADPHMYWYEEQIALSNADDDFNTSDEWGRIAFGHNGEFKIHHLDRTR